MQLSRTVQFLLHCVPVVDPQLKVIDDADPLQLVLCVVAPQHTHTHTLHAVLSPAPKLHPSQPLYNPTLHNQSPAQET